MPRKNLTPNSLEARKQLLIAESEINRTLFGREHRALAHEIRTATEALGKASAVLLAVKAVMAVFKAAASKPAQKPGSKRSWLSISLNLLRMGLPLWYGLHQRKNAKHHNGQPAAEEPQTTTS